MRILLGSDDAGMTSRLREALRACAQASDEVEALGLEATADHAVRLQPHAVVLNLGVNVEQTLETLREVAQTVQTRVLVVGPGNDAPLILRTLREGAYRYVDAANIAPEVAAALDAVRTEPASQREPGRLIVVTGPAGGSGASTIAANIATVLAEKYDRCALIDLNLDSGDLATLLDLEPDHSVADFCRNVSRMDPLMFEQCFAAHKSGVHLLAAPREYRDVAAVTPRPIRKLLSMARASFPFVVLDLDRAHREVHAQALYQAAIVLLVVRLDFVSLRQAARELTYIDELGIPRERVRLVANRYRQPRELPIADVERALGMKVTHFVPDDPKSVNRANNKGVPVVLEKPWSRSSRSLWGLAESVNGLHRPGH
jgi:pilus assembly protein CpaE